MHSYLVYLTINIIFCVVCSVFIETKGRQTGSMQCHQPQYWHLCIGFSNTQSDFSNVAMKIKVKSDYNKLRGFAQNWGTMLILRHFLLSIISYNTILHHL
jgi:hypothetical protein